MVIGFVAAKGVIDCELGMAYGDLSLGDLRYHGVDVRTVVIGTNRDPDEIQFVIRPLGFVR